MKPRRRSVSDVADSNSKDSWAEVEPAAPNGTALGDLTSCCKKNKQPRGNAAVFAPCRALDFLYWPSSVSDWSGDAAAQGQTVCSLFKSLRVGSQGAAVPEWLVPLANQALAVAQGRSPEDGAAKGRQGKQATNSAFRRFLALAFYAQHCEEYHGTGSRDASWGPHCGPEAWFAAGEACNCTKVWIDLQTSAERGEGHDAPASSQNFARTGSWNGGEAAVLVDHLPLFAERSTEPWARFVVRLPRTGVHHTASSFLEKQQRFGERMYRAAQRFADVLQRRAGKMKANDVLDVLGTERRRVRDEGEEGGTFGERRTDPKYFRYLTTALTMEYRTSWREALSSRRKLAGLPPEDGNVYGGPEPRDDDRARACGALITWADLPWKRCANVLQLFPALPVRQWPRGLVAEGTDNQIAGVYRNNETSCRVVFNRAVRSSVLAGLWNGVDCAAWYGVDSRKHAQNRIGLVYHASGLSMLIAEQTLLQDRWREAREIAKELHVSRNPAVVQTTLQRFAAAVAAMFWLVANTLPFIRGTATSLSILHHGLWLWAARDRAQGNGNSAALLRCVPMWAEGSMPDLRAWTYKTEREFVHEGYYALFDGAEKTSVADTQRRFLSCISSSWGAFHTVTRNNEL